MKSEELIDRIQQLINTETRSWPRYEYVKFLDELSAEAEAREVALGCDKENPDGE